MDENGGQRRHEGAAVDRPAPPLPEIHKAGSGQARLLDRWYYRPKLSKELLPGPGASVGHYSYPFQDGSGHYTRVTYLNENVNVTRPRRPIRPQPDLVKPKPSPLVTAQTLQTA
jgi:hypothetical protein